MNNNNNATCPVPPITDPLGVHWEQPDRNNIQFSLSHAHMSESDFKKLKNYSYSLPSGKYIGKMWKRNIYEFNMKRRDEKWFLCWFDVHDNPDFLAIRYMRISIL